MSALPRAADGSGQHFLLCGQLGLGQEGAMKKQGCHMLNLCQEETQEVASQEPL